MTFADLYWKFWERIPPYVKYSDAPKKFLNTVIRNDLRRQAVVTPPLIFLFGLFIDNTFFAMIVFFLAALIFIYYLKDAKLLFGKKYGPFIYTLYFILTSTFIYYIFAIRSDHHIAIFDWLLNKL